MNRSIHAATTEQGGVGGVYDGIDVELDDVGLEDLEHRLGLVKDLGKKEGGFIFYPKSFTSSSGKRMHCGGTWSTSHTPFVLR